MLSKMKRSEETEQITLIHWCNVNICKYPELELIYHVPNGGKRNKSDVLSERCGVKRGRGGRTGVGNGNVYVGFRYNEVKRDLQRTRHFFYSISRRNERLSDLFSKRGGWGYLLSV